MQRKDQRLLVLIKCYNQTRTRPQTLVQPHPHQAATLPQILLLSYFEAAADYFMRLKFTASRVVSLCVHEEEWEKSSTRPQSLECLINYFSTDADERFRLQESK